MSAQHTQGQMTAQGSLGPSSCDWMAGPTVLMIGKEQVAIMSLGQQGVINARRLAACWNLLIGVPTEKIEASTGHSSGWGKCAVQLAVMAVQRDELLAALKDCLEDSEQAVWEYIDKYGETYRPQRLHEMRDVVAKARAAITKATGEQA